MFSRALTKKLHPTRALLRMDFSFMLTRLDPTCLGHIVGESEKMTRRGGKENSKMREMTGKGWPKRKGNKMEIRERE